MKEAGILTKVAIALYCLGLFTITWDKVMIYDLGGFTLRLSQLLFLSSALCTIAAAGKQMPILARRSLWSFPVLMGALGAYYLATTPWSYFPLKSFLYSGWLFFDLFVIWLVPTLLRAPQTTRWLTRTIIAALAFHSLIIIIDQIAFQFGYTTGFIGFNQNEVLQWGVSRPYAFSFEPSYIGTFLCLGSLFVLPTLKGRSFLYWAAMLLTVFAMIATTSRTAWICFALGTGFFIVFHFLKYRTLPWKPIFGASAAIAIILGAYLLSMPAQQRTNMYDSLIGSIAKGTDGSGNHRLKVFGYAVRMAKETHWVGTGLGASFRYWSETVFSPDVAQEGKFGIQSYGSEVVLSTWGQLLAEGGIIAVLLYLAAACSLALALFRKWMLTGSKLALGSLAGALVWFLFGTFWLGNIARGDIWVWYAAWSYIATFPSPDEESAAHT